MEIPNALKRQLSDICARYGVEILYVFGSRAREILDVLDAKRKTSADATSDADIGVKLSPSASLSVEEKVRLGIELEDLLDVNRVDLCVLQEADPFLAAEVIRGERLYCEDEYVADEYDLYILRRAGDLIPHERERLRLALQPSGSSR